MGGARNLFSLYPISPSLELLVSLISLERNPEPSFISAEYVSEIAPVFERFAFEH